MAEAAALAGVGWVVSPIFTKLLNKGFSYLGDKDCSRLAADITDRLDNVKTMIDAAEKIKCKIEMEERLRKLKDAVYEAEDVLDLYKYQLVKEKVSDLNTRALKSFKKVARKVNSKLPIFSSQKIKLRTSLNKLEVIAAEAKTFCDGSQIGNDDKVAQNLRNGGQPDVTTSFLLHKVFGREKELDEIVDRYLLDQSEAFEPENRYSIVAIVGIGGTGKTTLAQLVYTDKRVVAHFDIKMWVCVSRKLDLARNTKDMIESSGKSECPNLASPEAIQSKLVGLVKSKKVLLVLDDVYCDKSTNETEWQRFLAPLATSVESGSKVLVTTRTNNLPVALRPHFSWAVEDLEENHILSLFQFHAFGGTKLDDSHLQEDLMIIGKQIVRKLHRSPLAAKVVGCQLGKTLKVDTWKAALERDNLGEAQQALLWSYQRLDAPLQRCFSYCSLFPKGHKYRAEEMTHLWIAEGFVKSSNDSKRMEDIGREYFDELVSGSFLQHNENNAEYYMHDLFHDLAENVSKEDCLRIEDDQVKQIPQTIRHLRISDKSLLESHVSFHKLENLRTLFLDVSLSSPAIDKLSAAIKKSKKLRVLALSYLSRGALAKFGANQKHLRFLSFSWSEDDELPAMLGKLYHLQVLYVPRIVNSLPRSVKNLINLRHFMGDEKALALLPYIGRLTSLQRLLEFVVKKVKGHDIGQLKNLNEIRGSLTISNLENTEGKDKAIEANLKGKIHLQSLLLKWDNNDDQSENRRGLDLEVLEGLQPQPNLTNLTIEGYMSSSYPSWLLRKGCLQNLRSLEFNNCTALEVLPPISKLFPRCTQLRVSKFPKLRKFLELPQSLKELMIRNCPSLIIASKQEVQMSVYNRKKSIMNIMRSYQLINRELNAKEVANDCLKVKRLLESEKVDVPEDFMTITTALQSYERIDDLDLWEAYCRCQEQRLETILGRRKKSELMILPSSLQNLELETCNITDGALSQSLQGLTSLKSLVLYNISTITTLPAEEVLHLLIALIDLRIYSCPWLKSLGGLYALPSLEELEINSCPCLEVEMVIPLPGEGGSSRSILPSSLRFLNVWGIMSMKSFVVVAGDLPNLVALRVQECPSLASLSLSPLTTVTRLTITVSKTGLLSLFLNCLESLKELYLDGCSGISSLPEHLPESLRELYLHDCPSISSLPEHLPESLGELYLHGCPGILSLPDLPESLGYIQILNCPILEMRCRSPNGEDWHKIAHIPERYIYPSDQVV